ncbi:COMPASS (complex proteins associated with Set1p) component [Microsporum ferrugineum]
MADAPSQLPGGNPLPSGAGFQNPEKQNNGETLQDKPITMQDNTDYDLFKLLSNYNNIPLSTTPTTTSLTGKKLTYFTPKSSGSRIISQSLESNSTPKPTAGVPPPPTTASTTSRGVTPSVDNESSTNKHHDNRDIIMGGGYETRGAYRGNGAGGIGGANATPQAQATGAPARIYMNEKIVPYLLEGMKMVAKDQPMNPLQVLGEYLIQRSSEIGETAREQSTT